ncbi:MAG: hypothetical protein ABI665_00370 [Vicinamibacterales bacterium]
MSAIESLPPPTAGERELAERFAYGGWAAAGRQEDFLWRPPLDAALDRSA